MRQEVEGFVVWLERPERNIEQPGEVVVATQLEDYGSAKVHVRLAAPAYSFAADAHRDRFRVHVLGTLTKTGRRFELRKPSGFEVLAEAP